MKFDNLSEMIRGWIVGDFEPSLIRRDDIEIAIQRYKSGDSEPKHVHQIATEITVIASGEALLNGEVLKEGAIVTIEPGEAAEFKALTDVVTVVVKTPSIPNDKYLVE